MIPFIRHFITACLAINFFNFVSLASYSRQEYLETQQYSQVFNIIPQEIISNILDYKDINTILATRVSSKALKRCAENPLMWEEKLKHILYKHDIEKNFKSIIINSFHRNNTLSSLLKFSRVQKVLSLWKELNEKDFFKSLNSSLKSDWLKIFLEISMHGNTLSSNVYKVLQFSSNPFNLIYYSPFLTNCDFSKIQFKEEEIEPLFTNLKSLSQIKNLSFLECNIGNHGVSYLSNILENHKALEILNIVDNNITDDGALVLSLALNKNLSLKKLEIANNDINKIGVDALKDVQDKKNGQLEISWTWRFIFSGYSTTNYCIVHPGDTLIESWLENPTVEFFISQGYVSSSGMKKLLYIISDSRVKSIKVARSFKLSETDIIIDAILNNTTLIALSFSKFVFHPGSLRKLMTQGNFTSLHRLSFHSTNINSEFDFISKFIMKHSNLRNLQLSGSLNGKSIWLLEKTLKNVSFIESLDLSNNNIDDLTIQNFLKFTTNLKALCLSENQLKSFPSKLVDYYNLEELRLNNNKLSYLPDNIYKLTNLKHLEIANNNLSTLPKSFSLLTKLYFLDIKENSISNLPTFIEKLPNLQLLVFHQNRFVRVPEIHSCLSKLDLLQDRSSN